MDRLGDCHLVYGGQRKNAGAFQCKHSRFGDAAAFGHAVKFLPSDRLAISMFS